MPVPRQVPGLMGRMRAVVSDGHVYIHHGRGGKNCTDLDSDPAESRDLSGSEASRPDIGPVPPGSRPTHAIRATRTFDTRDELR